jgi:hypothetical protein
MTGLDSEVKEQAQQAINDYTRHQLYSALHIPAKYILDAAAPPFADPEDLAVRRLKRLCDEMEERGLIRLDKDGEPCCLSGEPWPLQPLQNEVEDKLQKFIGRQVDSELAKEIEKEFKPPV